MFVIYDKDKQLLPIKIWLDSIDKIDPDCLQQAYNLSNLPFAVKHVALLPDTHTGYGMPIGGVLVTKDVIVPYAVGNDIGCGMVFCQTNIPSSLLKETVTPSGSLVQSIIGSIQRAIPVGPAHHKSMQTSTLISNILFEENGFHRQTLKHPDLAENCFPAIWFQLGTMGSNNHFIEIQEDEEGKVAIMIHSGSRNLGKQIAQYFGSRAVQLNEKWHSKVPKEWKLAFLPIDTEIGQDYIEWMNFALLFAKENREKMMFKVKEILFNSVKKYCGFTGLEITLEVNAHHNYAAIENHFGQNVWVHRKGAIRAREGELGIIPGAMGSNSYIVRGLGNKESFTSCSHGAGRTMSRTEAADKISTEKAILDLKEKGVVLGTSSKEGISAESRFAYKDINYVVEQEKDLCLPIKRLTTIGVIKDVKAKRKKAK